MESHLQEHAGLAVDEPREGVVSFEELRLVKLERIGVLHTKQHVNRLRLHLFDDFCAQFIAGPDLESRCWHVSP